MKFNKLPFIVVHTLKYKNFVGYYEREKRNEFSSYLFLEKIQEEKLPILTKKIIKENYEAFTPKNIKTQKYLIKTTGGSTGDPLKYRISKDDWLLSNVLLYFCWGFAGYELGDKMFTIGGSSLFPTTNSIVMQRMTDFVLNSRNYSSFDLTMEMLKKIFFDMNKHKPKLIRGYASSVFLLAKFIENENLKMNYSPKGVFTTAEVLLPYQREVIEKVFGCKVFDQYGLNDGGVIAYSLGNFVFDMHQRKMRESIILRCDLLRDGRIETKTVPVFINETYQPEITHGSDALGILSRIERLSLDLTREDLSNFEAKTEKYKAEVKLCQRQYGSECGRYFLRNFHRYPKGMLKHLLLKSIKQRIGLR